LPKAKKSRTCIFAGFDNIASGCRAMFSPRWVLFFATCDGGVPEFWALFVAKYRARFLADSDNELPARCCGFTLFLS